MAPRTYVNFILRFSSGSSLTKDFAMTYFHEMNITGVFSGEDAHGVQWAFVDHNVKKTTKQWVDAIKEYNEKMPNFPHLHINLGAGQYEEPIIVREGKNKSNLNKSHDYKFIVNFCKTNRVEWCVPKKLKDITIFDNGQSKRSETPATDQEQPKVLSPSLHYLLILRSRLLLYFCPPLALLRAKSFFDFSF